MGDGTRERLGVGPLVEAFEHGLAGTLWGVVLFGSTARGEVTESSDVDILVVADGLPERFTARMRFLRGLVPPGLRGRVSLLAKTRAEFESGFPSYYLDLGLDGIILCDRDNYTERKLDRIRGLTASAGLTRHRIDHGFVWRWTRPPTGHWRVDWSGVHGL